MTNSSYCALIVDDEPDLCELLSITLARMDIHCTTAGSVAAAKQALAKQFFHFCLTDLRLPDADGIALLEHMQQHYPNTPVAMITAHGDADFAVKALKLGAFDFVAKPIDLNRLRELATAALRLQPANDEDEAGLNLFVGNSPPIQAIKGLVKKVARSQAMVHITGESGTGKEVIAKMIHQLGGRREQAFVPVNCGAIPADLMESEFFGHQKGSFTGAHQDKTGLFTAANNGSLFLDEVADLPLPLQVKLLRAIQERRIRPIGSAQELQVDVRIISATHKDLAALTRSGQFREDLYYRLNVIEINIPPLRERTEDIPALCTHILARLKQRNGWAQAPQLKAEAINRLQSYAFPGNVRELENLLERAAILNNGQEITADELQLPNQPAQTGLSKTTNHEMLAIAAPSISNAIDKLAKDKPINEPNTAQTKDSNRSIKEQVAATEAERIAQALLQTGNNKTKAAALLGMSFRQLRYRLKKFNIK